MPCSRAAQDVRYPTAARACLVQPQMPACGSPSTAGLASNCADLTAASVNLPSLAEVNYADWGGFLDKCRQAWFCSKQLPTLCHLVHTAAGLVHVRYNGCACVRARLQAMAGASPVDMQAGLTHWSGCTAALPQLLDMHGMHCMSHDTHGMSCRLKPPPSPTCTLQRAGRTHPLLPRWRRPLQRSCSG